MTGAGGTTIMASDVPRTVVITGATRGLGRAMAGGLIARGHLVLGCGRSAERVAALRDEHPSPNEFDAVDVTDREAVGRWARRLIADHGPPDLLVNNAAIINANATLWEVPADEFDRVIDVNVKGLVNVIRAFAPAMVARGSGVFVNFSSYWGRSVAPEVAPYCATKWAVEGLTQAMARELPEGMAAVAFNPGVIDTAMLRSTFAEGAARYLSPDRWADKAVPFLLELGPEHNGKGVTAPGQ